MENSPNVVDPPGNELLPISPRQVLAQVQAIQQLMSTVMKDKEHYGTIPGCGPKPTLLKAGAEKLAFMFRLAPRYDVNIHDLDGGHFRYELRCRLESLMTGRVVAEGVGCCSSLETKYAFAGKDADGNKLPRQNLEDVRNTVEKMAAKRALVAAVLNGTAASDIFTQDLEELTEGETLDGPAQPTKPPVQPPQRRSPVTPPVTPNGTADWRKIQSKFDSKCNGGCDTMIKSGMTIYYSPKDKVAICEGCYDLRQNPA